MTTWDLGPGLVFLSHPIIQLLGGIVNPLLWIHPGRLTWNLQITHLERKMIFQTSMIMFHVNLQGCMKHDFHQAGNHDKTHSKSGYLEDHPI